MSSYYDKADYILTIAEEGNISRAAQRLYVSQSTLTMYLNRIEAEFGTPLFDRSVRPIAPTKAGTLYINDLKAVRRMEQRFLSNLHHLRNPNETLNIGIGPIRSKLYMPRLISKLRERYPDISVNITEMSDDNLARGLLQGKYDVIFGCFSPADIQTTQTVAIGKEVMGIIAPKAYGLASDKPNSPERPCPISVQHLKHLPIVIPGAGSDLHDAIVEILNRYAVEPNSIVMTRSTATAIALAAEGDGYAFVEYPFLSDVHPDLRKQLDYLSLNEASLPNKQVVACYSKNSIKQEAILNAINFFYDIFNK